MNVVSSQWSVVSKRIFSFALCAMFFALRSSVDAQQTVKIPRIGFLTAASLSSVAPRVDGFRQGLRELGYVEGKTLSLSGDTRRENQIVCMSLRPNLYV